MSKIDELLKNEKVEWKKLGEVCEIINGKQFNKRDMLDDGKYPVINGGVLPSGYIDLFNCEENTITISQGGASAGFVNYIREKFWLGAHAFAILPSEKVNKRYIFHFLKNIQLKLQERKEGAGIPSIAKTTIVDIKIPIPSLKTQEKIVEILDKLTNYVTELQAELQAELQSRIKQYDYYRDHLLSEEKLNEIAMSLEELGGASSDIIRMTNLGEIGVFVRGNGLQKKDFQNEGCPVIHYGQLYTNFAFETDKVISHVSSAIFDNLKKAQKGDLLIATTSENLDDVGRCILWNGDEEIGFSSDMYSYRTKENSKYIAYFLQSTSFSKQKEMKISGTKVIRIHHNELEKIKIPLPPLSIQNRVVAILDKFQEMLSATKGLLPKEIEDRQKEYEYYREKLLTFSHGYVTRRDETRRDDCNC